MKTVIIDDEPRAIELLQGYIQRLPNIECVESFRDPIKAMTYLNAHPIDGVFLDIDMPGLSGLSLAKLIPNHIQIVFTTAYSEFAVESYEIDAVDYLLKPISFERFVKAVQKLRPARNEKEDNKRGFISLKSGYDIHRVSLDDILYLQKDGNYMTYHTGDQKVMVRESITNALNSLPDTFIQVHKSYIVAVNKINVVDKDGIHIQNSIIPLSVSHREKLLSRLT